MIYFIRIRTHRISQNTAGHDNLRIIRLRLQKRLKLLGGNHAVVNQAQHLVQNQKIAFSGYKHLLCKIQSVLARKYKIKDVKGALYFSLLDLATLDPDLGFSKKESAIFEDKCKRHQKRVDEMLNAILGDVDRLKRQLVDGYHHHHLKKIPLLSNDVPNEHFFQKRPGSDRRDYKRRSLLAFALYCIQNPDTPAEVIERFLAKFDFGQNFMKKVKAFIEKGGFNHEG